MSLTAAENFLRNASEQLTQRDINNSIQKAVYELTRELKRLDSEIRRLRREIQFTRRF